MRWNQNFAARRGGECSTVRAPPALPGHRQAEDGEPGQLGRGVGLGMQVGSSRRLYTLLAGPRSRTAGMGRAGRASRSTTASTGPLSQDPPTLGSPRRGMTQAWGEKWGAVGSEPLWAHSSGVTMVRAEPPLTRHSLIGPHY